MIKVHHDHSKNYYVATLLLIGEEVDFPRHRNIVPLLCHDLECNPILKLSYKPRLGAQYGTGFPTLVSAHKVEIPMV